MERIQILLELTERQALKQLADEANTSMSNIVRGLLRERLKERRRAKLRRAAQLMADEYRPISLDPTVGAEIRKTRPAVIVSSDDVGNLPLHKSDFCASWECWMQA